MNGIIITATGDSLWPFAIQSSASVKAAMPDALVYIATDRDRPRPDHVEGLLVLSKPKFDYADKISALEASPFERTVLLDADTRVIAPFFDVFDLLEHFDIVGVLDTQRWHVEGLPDYLPEINTGMIGFGSGPAAKRLQEIWRREDDRLVASDLRQGDQTSLRLAMHVVRPRFWGLPNEYNFCLHTYAVAGFGSTLRVIHGPPKLLDTFTTWCNASHGARVFLPSLSSLNRRHAFGGTRSIRILIGWIDRLRSAVSLIKKI